MLVKRVVYYVLATGPFLLIGLIAINSRLSANHWEFIEYGPENTARLEAYSRPVQLVRQSVVKGRPTSVEALRETIATWLGSNSRGELRDIVPPTTQWDGSTMIYDQIVSAKQALVDSSLRYGHVLQTQGRTRDAAYFYADVLELADIGKFSEFSSVAESATYQVSTLRRLAQMADQLEPVDRTAILSRLTSLDGDRERSLAHVVDRLAATYSQDLRREGRSATPIEAARDRQRLASNEDVLESRIQEWEMISSNDPSMTSLSGRCRIAHAQQSRFQVELTKTIAVFEAVPSSSSN